MKTYFQIWSLTLFLKLAISAALPLIPDEAYYWVWSLFPQLSYFDHPPMSAWLLWLGHFFDSWGSMVRWPSVILGHCIWLIWFFIFQQLKLESKVHTFWFWLTLLSPLLGFGSILITPDLPLLVFWSLSLLFFLKYLDHPSSKNALGLGVSLGLGFLSKYMIVLFVPLALFALWRNNLLKKFHWPRLYIIILFGFIFCLPVLIWNQQHQWVSFQFQLKHGLHQNDFSWHWPVEYVLGQIIALFPLIFWSAIKNNDPRVQLLKAFAWGPLVFFFLTSFRAPVEGNWPIMAYPAFYALALTGAWSSRKQWITLSSWGALYLFIGIALYSKSDKFVHGKILEPFIYRDFSPLVKKYEPLFGINYQLASALWFQSKIPVYKLSQSSRYDFFDTFAEGRPKINHFFVIKQKHHDLPQWITNDGWQLRLVESLKNDYLIIEVKK